MRSLEGSANRLDVASAWESLGLESNAAGAVGNSTYATVVSNNASSVFEGASAWVTFGLVANATGLVSFAAVASVAAGRILENLRDFVSLGFLESDIRLLNVSGFTERISVRSPHHVVAFRLLRSVLLSVKLEHRQDPPHLRSSSINFLQGAVVSTVGEWFPIIILFASGSRELDEGSLSVLINTSFETPILVLSSLRSGPESAVVGGRSEEHRQVSSQRVEVFLEPCVGRWRRSERSTDSWVLGDAGFNTFR